MMLSDEETGNKVSLEDLLDKYSETQSQKFEDMLDKRLETHVESKIAKALEPIKKRLDALEKRGHLSSCRTFSRSKASSISSKRRWKRHYKR